MDKAADVHDCQEWVKTAPVEFVRDFLIWSDGVLEMRRAQQKKRKRRSDAGKPREYAEQQHFPMEGRP